MTDYTRATGSSATMMIRDTGTYVEFWINSNNSVTWMGELPWAYVVNGVSSSWKYYNYQAGAGWEKLGSWLVTTDQTVTFKLGDTGTSGFGGPTNFSVSIDRTSAPPTPPAWTIEQIKDTSVQGDADGYPNGGLAIDQIQVRYDDNTSASSPSYFDPGTDGYGWITGLARGKTYYFWQRTHNAKGWSPWSSRTQATTHNFPPAPTAPVITNVQQTSAHARISGNGDGGSAVLEWQIGYGKSSTTPELTKSGWDIDITDLDPGEVYYFWGRGRNTYGWGAWSARSSATLFAGAWVNYNGVWKRAVPYVKYNGVWKVATPYAKISGLWKQTG